MTLDFKVTEVQAKNADSKARIVVNRGGTRSSKTYSLQQMWIEKCIENHDEKYLVTRKTFPALRLSAYQDFQDVLTEYSLWDKFNWNKTNHVFTYKDTGSEVHFVSADNPQKLRGVKWNAFQMSEANELSFETFRQLILRCPGQCYLDFNPSEEDVWINTEIEQTRNDFELIKSSYLDNPFLPQEIIDEIEYLKSTDPMYWQIFGLGEYGVLKHKVYDNYEIISEEEWDRAYASDYFKGLDFGHVNPMALVQCKSFEDTVYVRELYYKSYKDIDDLILYLDNHNTSFSEPIYSDPASPDKISQVANVGYNVMKANKKVKEGLDRVRRFKLKICRSSANLIKEINNYKYQEDKDGKVIEEPVKFNDHLMDAKRYAIFTHLRHVFVR